MRRFTLVLLSVSFIAVFAQQAYYPYYEGNELGSEAKVDKNGFISEGPYRYPGFYQATPGSTWDSIYARAAKFDTANIYNAKIDSFLYSPKSKLDSIRGDTLWYRRAKTDSLWPVHTFISPSVSMVGRKYLDGGVTWTGGIYSTTQYGFLGWQGTGTNNPRVLIGGRVGGYAGNDWDYDNIPYKVSIETVSGDFGVRGRTFVFVVDNSNFDHNFKIQSPSAAGKYLYHRFEDANTTSRAFQWAYRLGSNTTDASDRANTRILLKFDDDDIVTPLDKDLLEITYNTIACSADVFWADSINTNKAEVDTLNGDKVTSSIVIGDSINARTVTITDADADPVLWITANHATDYDPHIKFSTDATPSPKWNIGVNALTDNFELWDGVWSAGNRYLMLERGSIVFMGQNAGLNNTGGNNAYYGYLSGRGSGAGGTANGNAGFGALTLRDISAGSGNNNAFGSGCGQKVTTGSYNCLFGGSVGALALTTGTGNLLNGYASGYYAYNGNYGVFLGYFAGSRETGSNKLFIDNQDRTNEANARISSLVYGEMSATVANQIFRHNSTVELYQDNLAYKVGAGNDGGTYWDGTNMIIDPDMGSEGAGILKIGATADDTLNAGAVRVGDNTNRVIIDTANAIRLEGTSTVWEDYVTAIGPNNWKGTSNNPTLTKLFDDGAGSQGVYGFVWGDGDEALVWVQLPHSRKDGSDISPHIHAFMTSDVSPTDSFGIEFEYTWANIGDDFPVNSTLVTTYHGTGENFDDKHQLFHLTASPIDGTGKTISSILMCRIKRVAALNDNYAGGIVIVDFDVHYEKDSMGSNLEDSK